ncbi:hypothetical protein PAXINDRAFT_156664 [Paxillus involutus ATCC 200175]|uniref:Uncharacterized protein n=1 Tax=Paxillus involutus ATCC 200175 TaxID=664439 RepID=A0A0C9TZU5_PAXIN|nr:hypothetical protein PAXINDRAFT_156664 [Paxillus involutus ATCC 200175]
MDGDASWPLFQPLRKNKQVFTDAVVRDLSRALVEPKSNVAEDDDLPMDCDNDCEEEEALSLLPSPKQSPKKKKKLGMSASQIKFARDLCTTTHSVLQLLSTVFTVPALYQIFTDVQLRDMLTRVLTIPMADELPTPNARKTCALSIWLLQVQRLPEDVLIPAPTASRLLCVVEWRASLERKARRAQAVHDLSLYQPSTFIPAFTELLPSILANLLAPTLALRAQACQCLDADDYDGIIDFAAQAAGIPAQILCDPQLELTLKVGPPSSKGGTSPISSRSGQLAKKTGRSQSTRSNAAIKLGVVRELWASMWTTFPHNLLHTGGAKLIECLIEDESDLVWETDSPDDARKEWAKLCAETLVICDIDELRKFWEERSRSYAMMTYESGVQSLMWGCFIETWKADTEGSWEGTTILLGIPFE